MKLLLLGASGRTGRAVLTEALRRGHHVTALVRTPSKLTDLAHPRLTVLWGNLQQPASLAAAVPGHDAAILVAGSGGATGVLPLAAGTAKLIWELEVANVPRLVVLSRQGAGTSRPQMSRWWQWTTRLFNRRVFADHDQQEENVRQCGLDWTIVRATHLINGPATGYVAAATDQALPATARPRIARADVAACLLDQLTPGTPTRCALTITGAAVRQVARVIPAPAATPKPEGAWRYAGGSGTAPSAEGLRRAA